MHAEVIGNSRVRDQSHDSDLTCGTAWPFIITASIDNAPINENIFVEGAFTMLFGVGEGGMEPR